MSEGPPSVRRVWTLAYPLLAAGLTQIVVTVVDTVMLARLSATALGAFALAAPVYLVALVIVRGWATAVQVQVAQAHGADDSARVARVVRVGLVTAAGAGAVIGAVLYAVAGPVLRVLGASPELLGPGVDYLRVLAFAVPLAAVSFTLQAACGGVGLTRVSMYHAVLVNLVNLPLGLLLIFPAGLGVTGAALATLAATAAGAGYLLLYGGSRLPRGGGGTAEEGVRITRGLWGIGWPEMSTMGVGYLNEALLVGIAARVGALDLAAYRIVDNLLLIVFTVLSSAATAVTILAGQELGRGDTERAEAWRRAGVRLLLVMLAVPAAVLLLLGRPLVSVVTDDPAVAGLAWAAVPLALLSMAPMVPAMARAALLRARGDTRTVMVASVACDYLLLIPLGWLLGLRLGLGIPGLYLAWTAFAVCYAVFLHLGDRRSLASPSGGALPVK